MFYDEVQSYCRGRKMSLAEFERRCGIGNGTIEKWNRRNSVPSLRTLYKIEEFTRIPMKFWISEEVEDGKVV